jgi:hypothetical protein
VVNAPKSVRFSSARTPPAEQPAPPCTPATHVLCSWRMVPTQQALEVAATAAPDDSPVIGEVVEGHGVRFEHTYKPAMAKHAGGRPTKYDSTFPTRIREWFETFSDSNVGRIVKGESTSATGAESKTYHLHAGVMPTVEKWALSMGISPFMISTWCRDNPEFSQAVADCKAITKNWLVSAGARGLISPAMVALLGANYTDLRQPTQTTVAVDATTDAIVAGDPARAEALRKLLEYVSQTGLSVEVAAA